MKACLCKKGSVFVCLFVCFDCVKLLVYNNQNVEYNSLCCLFTVGTTLLGPVCGNCLSFSAHAVGLFAEQEDEEQRGDGNCECQCHRHEDHYECSHRQWSRSWLSAPGSLEAMAVAVATAAYEKRTAGWMDDGKLLTSIKINEYLIYI